MANKKYLELKDAPPPGYECAACGERVVPFLRGLVISFWRKLLGRPYCCVICSNCKEIVGHE